MSDETHLTLTLRSSNPSKLSMSRAQKESPASLAPRIPVIGRASATPSPLDRFFSDGMMLAALPSLAPATWSRLTVERDLSKSRCAKSTLLALPAEIIGMINIFVSGFHRMSFLEAHEAVAGQIE